MKLNMRAFYDSNLLINEIFPRNYNNLGDLIICIREDDSYYISFLKVSSGLTSIEFF